MKQSAIILLLSLGLMSAVPAINQINLCDVVCCETEKEKAPADDACPFGVCCCNCCMPCCASTFSIQFRNFSSETNLQIPADEKPVSNYLSDSWHPPEVV